MINRQTARSSIKRIGTPTIAGLTLALIVSCAQQTPRDDSKPRDPLIQAAPSMNPQLIRDFENKIVEALLAREAEAWHAQASRTTLSKREDLRIQIHRLEQLSERLEDVNQAVLKESNKLAIKRHKYRLSRLKHELVETRLATTDKTGSRLTGLLSHYTTRDQTAEFLLEQALGAIQKNNLEIRTLTMTLDDLAGEQNLYHALTTNEALYLGNSDADKHLYLNLISDLLGSAPSVFHKVLAVDTGTPIEVRAFPPSTDSEAQFVYVPANLVPANLSTKTPSILQINLENMQKHPLYEVEAKTYMHGIPGIHLVSTSRSSDSPLDTAVFTATDVPAYTLGWGLYIASLAREYDLYQSRYGELGSLILENRYAAILIVDLRLHQKTWTDQEASHFLQKEGYMSLNEANSIIDRSRLLPISQTSAFAGLLAFKQFRKEAQQRLGSRFDLVRFHRQLLSTGPLPFEFVEQELVAWLDKQAKK